MRPRTGPFLGIPSPRKSESGPLALTSPTACRRQNQVAGGEVGSPTPPDHRLASLCRDGEPRLPARPKQDVAAKRRNHSLGAERRGSRQRYVLNAVRTQRRGGRDETGHDVESVDHYGHYGGRFNPPGRNIRLSRRMERDRIVRLAIRPAVPLKAHLFGIVGAEFVAEELAA